MDHNERARHEALRAIQQFRDFANLCGCGPAVDLLRLIHEGLEAYREPRGGDPASGDGLDVGERTGMLLAYQLDAWGLTDHGTSLAGGWLTADGVRLRNAMRLVDPEAYHDEMAPGDGTWWIAEQDLHPNGYLDDGVQQVGDWHGRRPRQPYQEGHPGRSAPSHIVDTLLAVMRPHRGPRVGSVEYVKSARAEAQQYADRWWAEAFTGGVAYGLQIAATPRMVVVQERPGLGEAGDR